MSRFFYFSAFTLGRQVAELVAGEDNPVAEPDNQITRLLTRITRLLTSWLRGRVLLHGLGIWWRVVCLYFSLLCEREFEIESKIFHFECSVLCVVCY